MSDGMVILLLGLSAALAALGLWQLVLAIVGRDRQRLAERLASEWRTDLEQLHARSLADPRMNGMPAILARSATLRALDERLRHAWPEARLHRFLTVCILCASAGFVAVTLWMDWLLAGAIAGMAAGWLPMLAMNAQRKRRQRRLTAQLPEALDFLCRILRAGHSLATGIQMMGDELPAPIGAEFRRCYDEHSVGQPLEAALREMSRRIDSTDFAFFVTAVLIQRQTGGDLVEVLTNISTMIRGRVRLQQHVKAVTAEGRLTGTILFFFPVALFAITYALNPEYAGVLTGTDTGRYMLAAAAGLQLVGLFFIRRIVTVRA